ncbi:putative ubiquitin-conjugating enzyme E2 39 [Nymphaea thermarum]|nr:putative ubiquitin-conjugating enzyme E2 39 [Nymphaea thermarum]
MPGVTGFFNDPLENVVEVGKYDISQNEAIVDEHSNDSTTLGNDGHAMLVDGEEKNQSADQSEVSSGEAEALPFNTDDMAVQSNSMQQSDGSSLEFEAALLLNPDDLSYLGLNDGPGPMGTSPTSTISNNFDCYSENMKTGEDDDDVEDNSFSPWTEDIFAHEAEPSSSAGPSQSIPLIEEIEKTTELFKDFKPFDTVVDHSDHHFVKIHQPGKIFHIIPSRQKSPPEMKQLALKEWTKQVQHEWSILEKDLPDTVYVRAYEERMDLLRAVIVGAAGTPYHDGLFFFDICLPQEYPHTPPHFESFVAGYFRDKAPCILEACKAYMEGAQVGHLADGVQDVNQGHGHCSKSFKDSLSHLFPQLVTAFTDNGADCQKFVPKPKESRQRKLLVKVWN